MADEIGVQFVVLFGGDAADCVKRCCHVYSFTPADRSTHTLLDEMNARKVDCRLSFEIHKLFLVRFTLQN